MLAREGDFSAQEGDDPTGVNPGDEQWQLRQCPINGSIASHTNLEFDVGPLRTLPQGPTDEPTDERRHEAHSCIGEKSIKQRKD